MSIHMSVLESPLVCLFGSSEAPSDVRAFCTLPYLSLVVGGQKKCSLVIAAHHSQPSAKTVVFRNCPCKEM
jgi:hypothetical protein